MRIFLLYTLFFVFLTTNISKWYATLGSDVRVYYNHIIILLWMAVAIPYLSNLRYRMPSGIKLLLLLKGLFIFAVILGVPTLDSWSEASARVTYLKAIAVALLEGTGVIIILHFVTQLSAKERRTVVNLYLAALSAHITYTLLQGWLAYKWGIDIDTVISTNLPLWNGPVLSIKDEGFGLTSGTYFRLTGLTGDPNLNGMIMLIGLPILFYRSFERRNLGLVILLFALIGAIALTVSNTVILLSIPVVALMILRFRKRSRWIQVCASVLFVTLTVYFFTVYGKEIQETLSFKLDKNGTTLSHISLASEAFSVWRQHPFGVGANSYPRYSTEFSVHNSYLQCLVELGPLGLFFCLSWCVTCLHLSWNSRADAGYATMVAVGALILGSMGHDMLNRYEFQLILNLLVAIAILEHRASMRTNLPTPSIPNAARHYLAQ